MTLLILTACVVATPAWAQDSRYVTTTLRGKLTDPDTKKPLVGAVVRFTSVTDSETVEATTDVEGSFELAGLLFNSYNVEILTAEGENIQGINAFPVTENQAVEVILRISDRISSETKLENQENRFVSVVEKKKVRWKRFWKEFAVFFGIAAAGGAAAI